jgi:hypothetical protein
MIDDFEVAEATYRAAVARWPRARITLHESAQQESRREPGGLYSYQRIWNCRLCLIDEEQ